MFLLQGRDGHRGVCRHEHRGLCADGSCCSAPDVATSPRALDPTRPAWGYLNVVGLGGGDFHSVEVSAINPEAAFTKTCPDDPPTVTKHFNPAAWLLHILSQPNIYEGSTVVFKGQKSYDQGNRMDFLNLLPPGTQLPQIALDALNQTSSAPGIRLYTWEWELKPLTSGQTGGP